jgi:hypothetical protein
VLGIFLKLSHQPPSSEVQDKVAFIINNIVTANLEQKAKECLEVLKEQYYPWFAQYMVMKRYNQNGSCSSSWVMGGGALAGSSWSNRW